MLRDMLQTSEFAWVWSLGLLGGSKCCDCPTKRTAVNTASTQTPTVASANMHSSPRQSTQTRVPLPPLLRLLFQAALHITALGATALCVLVSCPLFFDQHRPHLASPISSVFVNGRLIQRSDPQCAVPCQIGRRYLDLTALAGLDCNLTALTC